ncbi:hypothetical protein [Butyrivibrio sp. WCD2001]|uniref:hypothetical protein n=1 Tax=Butyrivibrio sp. WCD2001 TaxID=1280681 RepID=UPI00040593B2|nr:hypothetical protein [Butyrivibrio sp. WCD2001]
MMKLSRIGAAALAVALSVTLCTPTTAIAASKKKPLAAVELDKQGDGSEGVDIDKKEYVFDGVEDETNNIDAEDVARMKMAAQGVAEGWLSDQYSQQYFEYEFWAPVIENGVVRTKDYYSKGNFEYNRANVGNYSTDDGKTYRIIATVTTYKNRTTGATGAREKDVVNKDITHTFAKGIRVKTGEITYLSVPLVNGDVGITNVKSSKKKIVKAERFNKKDTVTVSNDNISVEVDADGTEYFYTSTGQKIILGNNKTEGYDRTKVAEYASRTDSSATCWIKLTPNKSGKTKLSFDITNSTGTVTGHVETTVYSVATTDVFSKATYAGKSLLTDYSNSKNLNYGRLETDTEWDVSTAKSGKLSFKTTKNYVIKKIEVGTLFAETNTVQKNEYQDYYYERSASGSRVQNHEVDLNGDGDTVDTINGITESNVNFKYTTVKNNKKIKLSTIGYDATYSNSSKSRGKANTATGKTNYWDTNAAGNPVEETTTNNGYSLYAPTIVKVTVLDKLNDQYATYNFTIYRKVGK